MGMKLKMVRRGTFKANWNNTENMCGVTPSMNPTYNYVCEIECGAILDKHGFMIDQLDVDRYFQVKFAYSRNHPSGHPARSCERMAIECCEDVKYMVEAHMMQSSGFSRVHRIAVTIFFNETAAMTSEWRSDEACNTEIGRGTDREADGGQRIPDPSDSVSGPETGRYEGALEKQRGRSVRTPRVSKRRTRVVAGLPKPKRWLVKPDGSKTELGDGEPDPGFYAYFVHPHTGEKFFYGK